MAITTFIPELWAARLLNALEKTHVATNLVNRDYEGMIQNQGDTVHINSLGPVTVKAYTRNTDIDAPETLETTDQTLVIDQAFYFNFQVDDVDKVQAAGELIDPAMRNAAYGLVDKSDAYLLGLLAAGADAANTIGTKAAPIALTSENIYDYIVDLGTKLNQQNVPAAGRTLVVPPEGHALLLKDTNHFALANQTVRDDQVLNGFVGRIAGFDVYMSNNAVKATDGGSGGTDTYFQITAQVREAATYAEQILKTVAYRPENRFADAVKGLHVYGAKVTDGKRVAKLLATF